MGCILSSMDEDGRVREEFSYSLLAYLRNTGATLRQFTESDTLETEIASNGLAEPPSPPPNLLPPPPLPPFLADKSMAQVAQHEMPEYDDNYVPMLQIDPSTNSSLLFQPTDKNEIVESSEEENWIETYTEFEDEDPGSEAAVIVGKSRSGKQESMFGSD